MASPETNPISPQTSGSIRVVVADDHPIVRSGIKAELDAATGIEVVGEATDGKQVLSQVADLVPDVLLLDINMPGMRALAVMRDLAHLPRPPQVLVLTVERDIECVIAMLKAGATGYLVKDEHPCAIVDGVRAVAEGKAWLSQAVLGNLVEYTICSKDVKSISVLTPREVQVLRLVAQGAYNPQIARTLDISEGTVKNYVTNLYDKLDVHSRAELVAYAWQNRLMDKDQNSDQSQNQDP